jgi:hypothetical protein
MTETQEEPKYTRMIEDLTEHEIDVLKSVTENHLVVELLSNWTDDHAECVGVRLNGVEVSFWWLVPEAAAAFFYLDSPTAKKKVMEVLKDQLQDFQSGKDEDEDTESLCG